MAHDLLIVGGGINGSAIAREAALLGLSVLLVERDDLAQHTSSASSKLIHGGLRYLEYREFGLVREALQERERLIHAAPHLIHPMAFVLPHENAVRPWWLVRAGLYLYDALALGTTLPRSRRLRARDEAYRAPLAGVAKGFVYHDAFVDDARLTLANAIDAHDAGAEIATRTALLAARRKDDHWRATLSDGRIITARAIVNAAGPWVGDLFAKVGVTTTAHVRLVKGSHIVVPKLYDGDHAYILQQADGRIVFAIPWLRDYTAIGTTDIPVDRPEDARIDAAEIRYLCEAANHYFGRQTAPSDVVDSWSGVRPLFDDGASDAKAVTRDYVLELDDSGPALLSVFGGKITTARHLAEDALAKIAQVIGTEARHATRDRPFPGGDTGDFDTFLAAVRARFPFLGDQRSARMAHAYGTRLWEMLDGVRAIADMGPEFGAGLTAVELGWMRTREWARTAADVLDRRSKLRLTADPETVAAIEAYFRETI